MTESFHATPGAACYAIMRREGKIAFVLRQNTGWMDGYYSLPAGRVDVGESVDHGAAREALEEVGVIIQPKSLRHALTVHRHDQDSDGNDADWIDVFFDALDWIGEPTNAEPDKHSTLAWLDADNLPDTIIPNQRFALGQIALGNSYANFGW